MIKDKGRGSEMGQVTGDTLKAKHPSPHLPVAENSSPKRPRFTYAEMAKGALVFGILDKDGKHITKKAFMRIQTTIQEDIVKALEKSEWALEFKSWGYTQVYAKVVLADQWSAEHVCPKNQQPRLSSQVL